MTTTLMMTTALTTAITLYHNDNDVSEDNCYEDDENGNEKRISFSLINDKDNDSDNDNEDDVDEKITLSLING